MNNESVLLEKYLLQALGSLRTRNKNGPVKALRCNICGDSKSQPNATSAAILNSDGRWVYKCQRTGCEFNNAKLAVRWLRKTSPYLYGQYNQECLRLGYGDERSKRMREDIERQRLEQEKRNAAKMKENAALDKAESKTFREMNESDSDIIKYLSNRMIDWKTYPFHVTDDAYSRFHKCVIIPVIEKGKAVFWQGRKTYKSDGAKYLSRRNGKQGFLLKPMDFDAFKPVMVCEGVFSALSIENGICTFGVDFTQEQYEAIKSYEKAVFCFDNDRNGEFAGLKKMQKMIEKGHWIILWKKLIKKFHLPPKTNDLNDAAIKLGRKLAYEDIEDCVSNDKFDVLSEMW